MSGRETSAEREISGRMLDTCDCMAVWEAIIQEESGNWLAWVNNGEGASQARENAIELTKYIDWAWEAARELGYDDPYDWEFVPDILGHIVTLFVTIDDLLCAPVPALRAKLLPAVQEIVQNA